jgi:hypothetical protein
MEISYPTEWRWVGDDAPMWQSRRKKEISDLFASSYSHLKKGTQSENLALLERIRHVFGEVRYTCDPEEHWIEYQNKLKECALSSPVAENVRAHADLEQIFVGFVKQWQHETGGLSSTTRRYIHPSYQAILRLGPDAIPLILKELNERPDWWFEALTTLAKVNPVKPKSTFEEAVIAWTDWGKRNNLIF